LLRARINVLDEKVKEFQPKPKWSKAVKEKNPLLEKSRKLPTKNSARAQSSSVWAYPTVSGMIEAKVMRKTSTPVPAARAQAIDPPPIFHSILD